jgi:hypothetical protein
VTFRLLVLSTLLVALASCASQEPTQPPPTPRFGAPQVNAPRDIRPFSADPCGGPLNGEALRALGLSAAGEPRTTVTGERSCDWRGREGDQYVSLIVVPSRDVLVDTYRVRQYSVFQPTVIAGLPATREQSNPEAVSCLVTVGTADGQGFVTDYTVGAFDDGDAGDPCRQAQVVAERIVASLKPLPAK